MVLSLAGVSVLQHAQGPVMAPAALPGGGTVQLAGSIGPIPETATIGAAVAANTPITFSLEINVPTTPAEQAFEQGLTTPGSPFYHQYMSIDQYFQTYGPSPLQVQALVNYLTSQGLTVAPTSGPLLYTVSGPESAVASTFEIAFFHYTSASGASEIAPRGVPALPSVYASLVGSLPGINQFDAPAPTLIHSPAVTASGPTTPTVMRGFYNSASLISGGDTGSTYAIGLAEMCDPTESTSTYSSDVADFDSAYSLPAPTIHYIGSGSSSCPSGEGSSGWGVETDLDIQWAHAMAPGATLYVCLDTSNPDNCDQLFVTDHSSDNIEFGSNSWGGGSADHSVWQAAVADGMTLLASAGDSCSQVNYPAAEPDGLGVGGTTITPSGDSFGSETVWSCSGGEGTGGGCDTNDAPPSYQVGMTGYPGVCTSSERGVPDVAMDANPNSGVDVYNDGSAAQYGGTSLACPMWAASLDVIYQSSGASGFAAPEIYALAKSANYDSLFHDITSGSNGYSATVGWDPATGVGSPNIGALAAAWGGSTTPTALSATASATPTSGTAPLAVTFTGSASGGTSPYSYSWAFGDGTTSTSQSPSHTYSAAGSYTATLTVTDSESPAKTATASVGITVSAATSTLSASASATPTSGTAPLAVAFTGSASGGTSPYTYSWAFGDGSTSTSQSPSHTYSSAGSYPATLTVTDSSSPTQTATSSVSITVSAASSGTCDGTTQTVAFSSVTDCSLASGYSTVFEFKLSESQWDDYDYLNVYASNGATSGSGQSFELGTGMGGTPSISGASQTATGPNAKLQIDLYTEASGSYGGWGTYWAVVTSSNGAGGFCFEPKLSNGALGSGPSCSTPAVDDLAGLANTASMAGGGSHSTAGVALSSALLTQGALVVLLIGPGGGSLVLYRRRRKGSP